MKILDRIRQGREGGKKQFAILVDPDKTGGEKLKALCRRADKVADYFFVGGSLLTNDSLGAVIRDIRENSPLPVVLFPGNTLQVDPQADAILFLSLISGRNADLLIGKQVVAAPIVRQYGLESIATGYMLVDGGSPTAVQYMSDTRPIPRDKDDIAACTALAGEMLGLQCLFLDAGSGAREPVTDSMLSAVRRFVKVPVITGGGIRTPEQATALARAGADVVVVGNAIEKDAGLAAGIGEALHAC